MKIIVLCLIVMHIMLLPAKAQKQGQGLIDSLLMELPKAKEDDSKLNLLNKISRYYIDITPDEGVKYAQQSFELATKLESKEGIAEATRNMGSNYKSKGDYKIALEYYSKANLMFRELGDSEKIQLTYNSLGNAYFSLSDLPNALDNYTKSVEWGEWMKDDYGIALALNNMGMIYEAQSDYSKAYDCYNHALKINYQRGDSSDIADCLQNLVSIYIHRDEYSKALIDGQSALRIYTHAESKGSIAKMLTLLGRIYEGNENYIEALRYHFKALILNQEIGKKTGEANAFRDISDLYFLLSDKSHAEYAKQVLHKESETLLDLAKTYIDSAIIVYASTGRIKSMYSCYKSRSKMEEQKGNLTAALKDYKNYALLKDSVFSLEKDKKLTQIAMQHEFDKKETAAKEAQRRKDIRQQLIRNAIITGLAGVLIFLVIVYRQRNKIKAGKKLSDELLLNILPEQVAEELKAKGSAAAKQFDEVTVMFTDFKGFTQISEKLSPTELVNEIHTCFKAFDHIISKYNIEKIKTIGDAYMCAGGLPVVNTTNATDVVNAALDIQMFMHGHLQERKNASKEVFEIRIGIHTGTVVAGIVGVKKFAYDIWGDTVNIAARMEQSGESGKINISGPTYALVKNKFNCEYRGKIEAKNKGEIDMYFVSSKSEGGGEGGGEGKRKI